MTFELHVDAERWRRHLRTTAERLPGLVPVIKGNGYGLGRDRLSAESSALGADTVAVGVYAEVPEELVAQRDGFADYLASFEGSH